MSPIVPARFRSPLTTPRLPAPTESEYRPHHEGEYDYLTLQDRAAAPTPAALQGRYPDPQYYVTLTITLPTGPYTTTILLGDTSPTPLPTAPVQQSASQPTLTPAAPQNPNSTPGNVAGIVIGVLGSFAVLAGIYYVWLLRARQLRSSRRFSSGTSTTTRTSRTSRSKRRRRKKKRKSKTKNPWLKFKLNFKLKKSKKRRRSRRSSTSTGGPGPAPPPPGPPPPPPGPGPPPPPPPPAE
ncbi:hypothetical protein F5882DRAFT_158049 [Hyaloscypha sp. PMI_1271]|nr:hypothetical protein F5882DRAFT_158049 [Hyaloscypha sp. PMI_1271]